MGRQKLEMATTVTDTEGMRIHTTDHKRKYKQDLPPKGGYEPINYKRIPAKNLFSGKTWLIGYGAAFIAAAVYYKKVQYPRRVAQQTEEMSVRMALEPLLLAERDREYMKQLRKNRDYEAEIMKNVPGWEVGTWFGHPVYKTDPEDAFEDGKVNDLDFYMFCKQREIAGELKYHKSLVM